MLDTMNMLINRVRDSFENPGTAMHDKELQDSISLYANWRFKFGRRSK
jgi:hypothetical protein